MEVMKPLVIEDSGFKLEQVDIGQSKWDLSISKTVTHKDGTTSKEWSVLCYGVTIPFALETIISCRMAIRNIKENENKPLSLLEFFTAYQAEKEATLAKFKLETINLSEDGNN